MRPASPPARLSAAPLPLRSCQSHGGAPGDDVQNASCHCVSEGPALNQANEHVEDEIGPGHDREPELLDQESVEAGFIDLRRQRRTSDDCQGGAREYRQGGEEVLSLHAR